MNAFILNQLPWLLSAITIASTYLAGNKSRTGWALGALNQLLWLLWILETSTWGFLPMNFILTVVFTRNYYKWAKEEDDFAATIPTIAPME